MSAGLNQQLLRLSGLLHLQQRARAASEAELAFLMVNDAATLLPYQQAALWRCDEAGGAGHIAAISGVAKPEANTPYHGWLTATLRAVATGPRALECHVVPAEGAGWAEWFPTHALWVPLIAPGKLLLGGLLYGRADPWSEADAQVLALLAEACAQSWLLAHQPVRALPWAAGLQRRRKRLATAGLGLLLLALFPVRQSILAPAEVVPVEPLQIRAPFEGVVDSIAVQPNAVVQAGDKLAALDVSQLRTRYQVAVKARDMTQAEYEQSSQQAMSDPKAKGRPALLHSKLESQSAEVAYLQDMLARAELTAPAAGVAIFDSASDWVGKPVAVGERIMVVADPKRIELEIQVPVAEAITFDTGSDVDFFRNVAPDQPVAGTLVFASYASTVGPDGVLAYRFRASLEAEAVDRLRLGLKGTAKLYGPRRPLAIWLLRRPLATVRQWLTL